MARHVFLSFVEEDLQLVELFRGQAKNANNDLEFDDYSVKVPINSDNASYVKQQIRNKIDGVSVTLCLIGYNTNRSDWVDWEIGVSDDMGKGIVGMRLHSSSSDVVPDALRDVNVDVVNWKIDVKTIAPECEPLLADLRMQVEVNDGDINAFASIAGVGQSVDISRFITTNTGELEIAIGTEFCIPINPQTQNLQISNGEFPPSSPTIILSLIHI